MAEGTDYKYGDVSGGKRSFLIGALVLVLAITFVFEWAVSGYFLISDSSEGDFASGTIDNVSWNSGYLEVVDAKNTGVFTSSVKSAPDPVSWDTMSWSTATPVTTNGLKMLFHLDEASGNISDSSGNGNVGVYDGTSYSQSGKIGDAIGFDGNDSVDVAPLQTVSGEFTVSVWAKLSDDSGSSHDIVGTRGPNGETSFDMKFDTCGDLCLHGDIGDGTDWLTNNADYEFSYNKDVWYHVVYVVNQTGYAIYVNGTEVASDFAAYNGVPMLYDTNDDHHLYIGQVGYADEYFAGSIDEVRVYSRMLSASEISQLYQQGVSSIAVQARSCATPSCSNSNWTSYSTSPASITDGNGQYFQYMVSLAGSARLYNVSMVYSTLEQYNSTIAGGSNSTNSNIYHSYLRSASTATNSFLKWANVSGTIVDDSNITGCMIFNSSNITDIKIWDAYVSGNYMYSGHLIYGSVLYDAPLNISELYWPPVPPSPPTYNNLNSNTSTPAPGAPVRMSAYWEDDVAVDTVLLETNDTGAFVVHDSKVVGTQSGWSDLAWHNDAIVAGTVIAWRLKANDTAGSTTTTALRTIIITEPSTEAQATSSGSSSGGTGSCTRDFDIVSPKNLEVESGKTYDVDITIKNTGTCALFETTLRLETPSSWTKGPDAYFDVISVGETKTAKLSFTTHEAIIGDYNIVIALADSVGMDRTNKIIAKTKTPPAETATEAPVASQAGKPVTVKEQTPAITTPIIIMGILAAIIILGAYGARKRPWSTKLTSPVHRKHKK